MNKEFGGGHEEYRGRHEPARFIRQEISTRDRVQTMLQNKEMYRLSGDAQIVERDVKRYVESDHKLIRELPNRVKVLLDRSAIVSADHSFDSISEEERVHYLEQVFESHDYLERMDVLDHISQLEDSQNRLRFLRRALQDKDGSVRARAIHHVGQAPPEERLSMLEQALSDKGLAIRLEAIERTDTLIDPQERVTFFQLAFENHMYLVRKAVVAHVTDIEDEEKRFQFVRQGCKDQSADVQKESLNMIIALSENRRFLLLQQLLNPEQDYVLRQTAVEHLSDLVWQKERVDLIKQAVQDEEYIVRQSAIAQISYIEDEELRTNFVRQSMRDEDTEVRVSAIAQVHLVKRTEAEKILEDIITQKTEDHLVREAGIRHMECIANVQMRKKLLDILFSKDEPQTIRRLVIAQISLLEDKDRLPLIKQALQDDDFVIRLEGVKNIRHLSDTEDRIDFLQSVLENKRDLLFSHAIVQIEFLSEEERKILFEENPDLVQEWKMMATETPLYVNPDDRFVKKAFKKSGSETTLLDIVPGNPENSLKHRVILRHIKPMPYLAWSLAYKQPQVWKELGFNYIPIEPIVSATWDDHTETVTVATRVINGPSAGTWIKNDGLYAEYIRQQMQLLKQALEKLKINHNDTHQGNFIVYFDRDEKGEPILTRLPRVYVIDFDQATS